MVFHIFVLMIRFYPLCHNMLDCHERFIERIDACLSHRVFHVFPNSYAITSFNIQKTLRTPFTFDRDQQSTKFISKILFKH